MPARKATKSKKKKPVGRPSKYKPEYAEQAFKLCLLGHTDEELAAYFEVNVDTIYEWKKVYPEFSEAIKGGKDSADADVAQSLYKRANGYKYDEVTFEKILTSVDGIEEEDDIKVEANKKKVVTKEVAPDVTAQIFWLKNRQKKKWRDKIEHGLTDGEGNDVPPVTVFQIPDNGRSKSDPAARGVSDESPQQSG